MDLYPPFAQILTQKMKTRGTYLNDWPVGAIVHFTAGRDGAETTINGGIKDGYTYWCIQRDGELFCAHPADAWGYHAGDSYWPGLGHSVSQKLIGIEMNAGGRLKDIGGNPKYMSWFGTMIPTEEVRYTPGKDNQHEGYYQIYTPEQEQTLINTLLWLKRQNPDVFSFDYVLGHDEVAPERKDDPGAALSCTMPEFRENLKQSGQREVANEQSTASDERPTTPRDGGDRIRAAIGGFNEVIATLFEKSLIVSRDQNPYAELPKHLQVTIVRNALQMLLGQTLASVAILANGQIEDKDILAGATVTKHYYLQYLNQMRKDIHENNLGKRSANGNRS